MSIQAITGAQAKPAMETTAAAAHVAAQNPKIPPPVSHVKADSVLISPAGQTALQESKETAAQTAQEARGGDRQAVKLLAKEEAAKAASAPTVVTQKPENLLK